MKLDWRLPERKEREYDEPPSFWIVVGIAVVVFIVAFVVTVMTWNKGQPLNSGRFLARVLLFPLEASVGLGASLYASWEGGRDRVDIWNYKCRHNRSLWQMAAHDRVAILGGVTLTPEKDLAERILGLEGTEPRNEGKILPLSIEQEDSVDDDGDQVVVGDSRVDDVLEKLVTPFVATITNFAAKHAFSILIYSDHEQAVPALQTLLRKLDLPGADRIGITRLESAPDASLVHRWMNEETMPDFCLVMACQLHRQGEEARYSEAAVSLLFASAAMIGRYRDQLRPQAYVYQPISSTTDGVTRALGDMLTAQQIPTQSVGHLWLTSMPRQARHAVVAASSGPGLKMAAHDTDIAIGKPGPASALLAQALAAEMVPHGQGTQLVATPGGAGVVLNLTGTHWVPVAQVTPVAPRIFLTSTTLMMLAYVAACVTTVCISSDVSEGGIWSIVGACALFVSAQMVSAWDRGKEVNNEFYGH